MARERKVRDLTQVRDQILTAIPDRRLKRELRETTEPLLAQYRYAAPETHADIWRRFAEDLELVLGELKETDGCDWRREVARIMAGSR